MAGPPTLVISADDRSGDVNLPVVSVTKTMEDTVFETMNFSSREDNQNSSCISKPSIEPSDCPEPDNDKIPTSYPALESVVHYDVCFNHKQMDISLEANLEGENGMSAAEIAVHDVQTESLFEEEFLMDTTKLETVVEKVINEGDVSLFEVETDDLVNSTIWVQCDRPLCRKWRRLSASLADNLQEHTRWVCKDNPDKKYAKCAVPQEMTNEEINHELGISESDSEGGDGTEEDAKTIEGCNDELVSQPSDAHGLGAETKQTMQTHSLMGRNPNAWTLIKHNMLLHRKRKRQKNNEVMVCQCRPSPRSTACGEDCLNRVLYIECCPDLCPCGEICTNQQFQRRSYKQLQITRAGRKGFGLNILEDVDPGSFIIEYVGEVLDEAAFAIRQKEYRRRGQKHYYFMTLNNGEVIDACAMGNFSRFLNHSCEPNSKFVKWTVGGELCLGLFAMKAIRAGEEITFDYNYERFGGAVPKRCYCGAPSCRGSIGGASGALSNGFLEGAESPQRVDREEEFPVMLVAESEDEKSSEEDERVVHPQKRHKVLGKDGQSVKENEQQNGFAKKRERTQDVREGGQSVRRKLNEANVYNGASNQGTVKRKSLEEPKIVMLKEKETLGGAPMLQKAGGSATISKASGKEKNAQSDVENELDALLDDQGGLKKRKDTAQEFVRIFGKAMNSVPDAKDGALSCSGSDLTLLLDALLKTTSQSILWEVMDSGGLGLLQTVVGQLGCDLTRTPIIRKLLRILQIITDKGVLSNKDVHVTLPRFSESFGVTISSLHRHKDQEVQRMVYDFCLHWGLADGLDRPHGSTRGNGHFNSHGSKGGQGINRKDGFRKKFRAGPSMKFAAVPHKLTDGKNGFQRKVLSGTSNTSMGTSSDWKGGGDVKGPTRKHNTVGKIDSGSPPKAPGLSSLARMNAESGKANVPENEKVPSPEQVQGEVLSIRNIAFNDGPMSGGMQSKPLDIPEAKRVALALAASFVAQHEKEERGRLHGSRSALYRVDDSNSKMPNGSTRNLTEQTATVQSLPSVAGEQEQKQGYRMPGEENGSGNVSQSQSSQANSSQVSSGHRSQGHNKKPSYPFSHGPGQGPSCRKPDDGTRLGARGRSKWGVSPFQQNHQVQFESQKRDVSGLSGRISPDVSQSQCGDGSGKEVGKQIYSITETVMPVKQSDNPLKGNRHTDPPFSVPFSEANSNSLDINQPHLSGPRPPSPSHLPFDVPDHFLSSGSFRGHMPSPPPFPPHNVMLQGPFLHPDGPDFSRQPYSSLHSPYPSQTACPPQGHPPLQGPFPPFDPLSHVNPNVVPQRPPHVHLSVSQAPPNGGVEGRPWLPPLPPNPPPHYSNFMVRPELAINYPSLPPLPADGNRCFTNMAPSVGQVPSGHELVGTSYEQWDHPSTPEQPPPPGVVEEVVHQQTIPTHFKSVPKIVVSNTSAPHPLSPAVDSLPAALTRPLQTTSVPLNHFPAGQGIVQNEKVHTTGSDNFGIANLPPPPLPKLHPQITGSHSSLAAGEANCEIKVESKQEVEDMIIEDNVEGKSTPPPFSDARLGGGDSGPSGGTKKASSPEDSQNPVPRGPVSEWDSSPPRPVRTRKPVDPNETWSSPQSADFKDAVVTLVRYRVSKCRELQRKEVEKICNRLAPLVISKELKKHEERKKQGTVKPILRSQLTERVKRFVEDHVQEYLKKQQEYR